MAETIGSVMVDAMLNGRIGADRLAGVLAEGTARLYGLYPRKGALEAGADADFTLVDPSAERVVDQRRLHSKQPQSPWHGRHLRGRVCMTILRGEVIARDGEPVGEPRGRLIRAQHRRAEQTARPTPLAFTAELDTVVTTDTVPA